ncbi:MAG: ribosome maturation factor RimP [Ornithinimicrobium sp.]
MDSVGADQQIRRAAEGALTGSSVVVDDVSVAKAGRRRVVRVTVARTLADLDGDDHTSAVPPLSLDEIAQASQRVSGALDTSGALGASPHTLEVSSAGVGAPLRTPDAFRRNVGRLVELTETGGEVHRDRLAWAGPEGVRLADPSGELLAWEHIGRAVVHVEFNRTSTGGDS